MKTNMSSELRIGNKSVGLIAVRGVVAESSSSSARDYSERFSNLMGGMYLHSELRNETSFFLQRDDGGELAVSFPAQIPLRGGHRVMVVYGTCSDGKSVNAIAMFNETLGSSYELPVDRLLSRLDIKYSRTTVSNLGCLSMVGLVAFVILAAVFFPKYWVPCTVTSPYFWMVVGGVFVASMAGAYVIDPLINMGEMKKIGKSLQTAVAELQAGLDQPKAPAVSDTAGLPGT
ncbi:MULTISPECIES: hypothetical protein [unclassified Polaromonas]|uniref:hypothetical protein n=1 Tax=unclassified Polaromonas TaxID=2638319 RepID=UPI000F0782AE|nr:MULTISPECIES: hypothetical protein [unclassified Polaromonas]AYQ27474.1 hypothetical protein DT070_05170 [Polaromonas sp. SP1]QGJ17686.1 hypothetical protein F7R28_04280 [Polaromonas sp. Pch-P]